MEDVLVGDDDAPDVSVYMVQPMLYDMDDGVIVQATAAHDQSQPEYQSV